MQIIKFKPEHITQFKIQSKQQHVINYLDQANFGLLDGFTILSDNHIIFIGGLHHVYTTRYVAWSIFAADAGSHMVGLFRTIKAHLNKILKQNNSIRIECTCDVNFPQAHRLAQLLNFQIEAPLLKHYEIDGRDSTLYALTYNPLDEVFK